jgi:Fe-S cluster assembly protein SufD
VLAELAAGENAVVDHYKIGCEARQAFHVGMLHVRQDRGSNVRSHVATFGGRLVRNDIATVLDGEGCECNLNGMYLACDAQHIDNHLRVEHAKPHCSSREFFKGVLDDRSRGVFSGRIVVREDAQKTDAKQTNMSLLLSEAAQVQSKPQLEIFADDVKCTHGATIGQVDRDAVFYLRSRGISESAARSLLIQAFARESLTEIRPEPLRVQLEKLLMERVPRPSTRSEAA